MCQAVLKGTLFGAWVGYGESSCAKPGEGSGGVLDAGVLVRATPFKCVISDAVLYPFYPSRSSHDSGAGQGARCSSMNT